jgi:hypothetical protein
MMKLAALAFGTGFVVCTGALGASAETLQTHLVCVGENQQICSGAFPSANVEFYGCGSTDIDAICYKYCGQPETPSTCSQTRVRGPESGGKCGYGWVSVRCYK